VKRREVRVKATRDKQKDQPLRHVQIRQKHAQRIWNQNDKT